MTVLYTDYRIKSVKFLRYHVLQITEFGSRQCIATLVKSGHCCIMDQCGVLHTLLRATNFNLVMLENDVQWRYIHVHILWC